MISNMETSKSDPCTGNMDCQPNIRLFPPQLPLASFPPFCALVLHEFVHVWDAAQLLGRSQVDLESLRP